jgi:hypothetical protein
VQGGDRGSIADQLHTVSRRPQQRRGGLPFEKNVRELSGIPATHFRIEKCQRTRTGGDAPPGATPEDGPSVRRQTAKETPDEEPSALWMVLSDSPSADLALMRSSGRRDDRGRQGRHGPARRERRWPLTPRAEPRGCGRRSSHAREPPKHKRHLGLSTAVLGRSGYPYQDLPLLLEGDPGHGLPLVAAVPQ